MRLIDTHCHIYAEEFDSDREELISASREFGLLAVLLPNIDSTSVESLYALCDKFPDFCYPMMGLHPTSVDADYVKELSYIEGLLSKRPYVGIGEIGIDLYWDKTFVKEQKIVFEEQLKWSVDMSLPVSIHTRNAFPEVFEVLSKVGRDKLKGVFHSFSGTVEQAKEALSFPNFKLGINGIVTYKNSDLPEVLKETATIHDIVVETDAPYLPPVPYRGKRNQPIYLFEIVQKIAEIFNLSFDKVAEIIVKNSKEIYSTLDFGEFYD